MPSARDLAADLLLRFDRRHERIHDGLDAARAGLADARDRALLSELVYGCIRRMGTLDAVLGAASKRALPRLNAAVRTALRLGLHQVLFLDRVPAHAAVDHAVGWARGRAGPERAGYVNGVLRRLLREIEGRAVGQERPRHDVPREDGSAVRVALPVFADPREDPIAHLAGRFSMPRWLVERWHARWGEARTAQVLRAGLQRPPMTVRARRDRHALAERLKARGVTFDAGPGDAALRIHDGEVAVALATHSDEAVIQDATSQRVAPLLAVAAGMRVLDLCAAPGGKTLHLADLMASDQAEPGRLVACDVTPAKLALLDALRSKVGALEFEVVGIDPEGPLPFEAEGFDRILVDAPCSNTGVLRRRVEARWRLRPEDVGTLARLQTDLLERALRLLAPGGRMVYSTCSLEPEEDEEVFEAFLARHPDLRGEVAFRAWPRAECDGGFAAFVAAPA